MCVFVYLFIQLLIQITYSHLVYIYIQIERGRERVITRQAILHKPKKCKLNDRHLTNTNNLLVTSTTTATTRVIINIITKFNCVETMKKTAKDNLNSVSSKI